MLDPNPCLKRAVAHEITTLDYGRPVTSNRKYRTPEITNPQRPEPALRRSNGMFVSHELAFYFKALETLASRNGQVLHFVTVNLSRNRTSELRKKSGRSPVGKLSHLLKEHAKVKLGRIPEMFCVVETSKGSRTTTDKKYHLHIVVALKEKELDKYLRICRKISSRGKRAVHVKSTYKQEIDNDKRLFDIELMGTKEYAESVKDIDPQNEQTEVMFDKQTQKYHSGKTFKLTGLNVCLADYLAKELVYTIKGGRFKKSKHFSATRLTKKIAKEKREEAYSEWQKYK